MKARNRNFRPIFAIIAALLVSSFAFPFSSPYIFFLLLFFCPRPFLRLPEVIVLPSLLSFLSTFHLHLSPPSSKKKNTSLFPSSSVRGAADIIGPSFLTRVLFFPFFFFPHRSFFLRRYEPAIRREDRRNSQLFSFQQEFLFLLNTLHLHGYLFATYEQILKTNRR